MNRESAGRPGSGSSGRITARRQLAAPSPRPEHDAPHRGRGDSIVPAALNSCASKVELIEPFDSAIASWSLASWALSFRPPRPLYSQTATTSPYISNGPRLRSKPLTTGPLPSLQA
jgi:hypothetical protein